MRPLRILVTNDDGIHAPGLAAAEAIARALTDDVWVVAPETDQSGVAHSLTLVDPLRLRQVDARRFAVRGTPTDCVIMAVKGVLDGRPDLVLSGVNRGQNIADDVTYSGTVAGAIEGSLLGIRSIALSQAYGSGTREKVPYETAVRHGPDLIRRLLAGGADAGLLFNVNFPDRPPDAVEGIEVVRQGKRTAEWLRIDRRIDARGNPYYWIGFVAHGTVPLEATDMAALAAGRIAVTPLHVDLTDDRRIAHLRKIFG